MRCATRSSCNARWPRETPTPRPPSASNFASASHQGDIIVEDGDIFGDGVNLAARLEGLADPGGICVSGRVHADVAGKLDVGFEDMGEQQVKNISRPVHVYRIRLQGSLPGPP